MKKSILNTVLIFAVLLLETTLFAQQPNPPGQVQNGSKAKNEAYLFAHMTHMDYGRLYYSVSLDGLHWTNLNNGKRVFPEYQGHPDICKGPDGKFYIAGNTSDDSPEINIWVSDDLIAWKKHAVYKPNLKSTPDYSNALQRIGAPKLYYDKDSAMFMLTWHTPHKPGSKEDPEAYWASQRTLYVLSKDLKTFQGTPNRLFDWDMGTIDVFIRKVGDSYYAILKDETYPTLYWTTGKTIRIAKSKSLLGPYSLPQESISPNFREAPMLIPSPDNKIWYMYYEQYPGVSYGLSISDNLNGPWFQASGYTFYSDWDKYSLPEKARHGCMIPISTKEYDLLVQKFGITKTESNPKK
ncbi:glycosyl hydrolase family 43 [Flavobacterium franklandianum]|uniref:glycoside hydrolase family 43 protein n=1 Tax=Flavobacterium franklandianum TaxID=2594430 RepID=UPI00117A5387|nr:glycoside hydrolase family 43 protein [Flavobacterium franklandianum]TRX28900.1 glycosyl hydrolase family 43 [Flavobacterium franklandianum]